MTLPTFHVPASTTAVQVATMTRTQAGTRLKTSPAGVDKLLGSGVLTGPPITTVAVDELADRSFLQVVDGELTVLRTDAWKDNDPHRYPGDDRRYVGFNVAMSDDDLAAASLRWWRCSVERVVDNQLFAVTIATIPVAVFEITGLDTEQGERGQILRPGEATPRFAFEGRLLGRLDAGGLRYEPKGVRRELRERAEQIMRSRVHAESGGPMAYLGAETTA